MDGVVSSEGVAAAICGCNARQHEGESAAIVRDDIEDLRMKRGAVRPRALLTVIWVTARIFVAAELFGLAKSANSTTRRHGHGQRFSLRQKLLLMNHRYAPAIAAMPHKSKAETAGSWTIVTLSIVTLTLGQATSSM